MKRTKTQRAEWRRDRFTKQERHLWERIAWTQSTSRSNQAMHSLILRICREFGATAWEDNHGNVYAVKGQAEAYPAIACHTDTVHNILPPGRYAIGDDQKAGTWWAYDTEPFEDKNGEMVHAYAGIGGDDKCGIYLALNYLRTHQTAKAAFFRDEEIGCLGAALANMEFFGDCTIVLEGDRRGNNDFVDHVGGTEMFGTEFRDAVRPILKRHGYDFSWGASTDVATLKEDGLPIVAANMSCGYHNPHCLDEYVKEGELLRAQFLMTEIADTLGRQKRWMHTAEARVYTREYWGWGSHVQDQMRRDDERYLAAAGYAKGENGRWFLPQDAWIVEAAKTTWERGDPCPWCGGKDAQGKWDADTHWWHCGSCKDRLPPAAWKVDSLARTANSLNASLDAKDRKREEARKANQAPLALPSKSGADLGIMTIYEEDHLATHDRPMDGCPHCGSARKMMSWSGMRKDWLCLECLDYVGEDDESDIRRKAEVIVRLILAEGTTALDEESLMEATIEWLRSGVTEIDIDRFIAEADDEWDGEWYVGQGSPGTCDCEPEGGYSRIWDSTEGAWYCLSCDRYSPKDAATARLFAD
jgi:tripeptide aminopeptidase